MNINRTRIEAILAERGLTQAALAANSGLSRQSISTILARGTCAPKSAGKLANALGVPVESLLEVNDK